VTPSAGGDFAYAVAENDIVFGSPSAVMDVLLLASKKPERTLASVPAFLEARNKLVSRSTFFLYLDAKFITRDIFGNSWNADTTAAAAKVEYDDAIGFNSLSAFALALSSVGGDGRFEGLLEFDRSKESLLSLLFDPPAVRLRGASVLPGDSHLAISFGLESTRLYDYFDRRLGPAMRRVSPKGESSADRMLKDMSASVGMKLREEFLAALGDEVMLAFDFGSLLDAATGDAPPSPPSFLVTVETTNPDVARAGLVRLLADAPEPPQIAERDDNGIVVAEAQGMACAVVDGLAIAGPAPSVAKALATYRAGRTLAAEQPFSAATAQMAGDVIGLVYLSPRLDQILMKKMETEAVALPGEPLFTSQGYVPSSMVLTGAKYDAGLYGRVNVPAEAVVAGIGLGFAAGLPSLFAARRMSFESAAIGNLRTLGSAEATFIAERNRYGTFAELVEADMLDSAWTNGCVRDGYKFTQVRVTKDGFEFKAEPAAASSGTKSFNILDDYVIRYVEGAVAPQGTKGRPIGT